MPASSNTSNALAAPAQPSQSDATAAHSSTVPSQEVDIVRRERHVAVRPAASPTPATSFSSESKRPGATVNSDTSGIQSAYAAFQEGNYSLARQRYQDVLRQDPRNVDAMNALGLIAWRSGEPDVAERMFRAAVNADPKDATANSQLALLYSESDPSGTEARLRNLIASQPNAAPAYYALGNLLSRQQRWNEAQQALFQAYTLDSDNPDVLFNLAVSLEHLNQASVARQFYDRALQAAARRPADFDRNVARSRVQALESR
jgi:tetratricopeptide (TPR) repeat protein